MTRCEHCEDGVVIRCEHGGNCPCPGEEVDCEECGGEGWVKTRDEEDQRADH